MISFDVISISPFDINFQEGPSGICCECVWSLSHSTKHEGKCDACRGQDSLSGAGSRRIQEQVARCLSCCEIGGTEWHVSVVPGRYGWTENYKSVKPSLHREKHLSPQLTRHVGSHKDLQ